jgi:6-pyruvoyltetrahydropterin/6-carboxytetrahydropterin synthase
MKYRIRKLFSFEAAHQLDRAFTKDCAGSIHGHSYTVEVFLTSKCLDANLMVIDFGLLFEAIEEVKNEWDHALLLSSKLAKEYRGTLQPSQNLAVLDASPTAEVMATHIANHIGISLDELHRNLITTNGLKLEKVRVHETATGWAEIEFDPIHEEPHAPLI